MIYFQVEIAANGAVMKDGQAAELPLFMDGTAILREANVIRVKNENGVNAYCDLTYDRCTLEVSGWYFGRTAGLLGTLKVYKRILRCKFSSCDE